MNWSSEFACGSREAGSTSGTIASKAGPKNAVPAPKTATSTSMCQSSSAPVSDRTAITPIASPRATSAASIRRRRSKRSLMTPPSRRKAIVGTVMAIPTTASAVGVFDSA